MESLLLVHEDRPLREFTFTGPLVIGRGAHCDIVVHDLGVPDERYIVRPVAGSVVVHEVCGGRLTTGRVFGIDESLPVGAAHRVVRLAAPEEVVTDACCTEPLAVPGALGRLSVVVGRGSDARRVPLDAASVSVGSAPDNDIVLSDRAVSAHHLRLEPQRSGVRVRDLGSRNGTWVDGTRVRTATVAAGALLRVGRSDLSVVPCSAPGGRPDFIAESPALLQVLAEVERLARLSWPVLVRGESGVGKEGIANALHRRGPRASRPFVAINAGGLPAALVESELFGHERGAFTGAVGEHRGVFEQADGGTLFLDEVGELPLSLQARLLRVLETWEIRRVGAERARRVDVRLVCATHRDLLAMTEAGTFRQDLYYRIARLVVEVPPLRERPRDIAALAIHFLSMIQKEVGPRRLSPDGAARLLTHGWPGNARELRNVISAAAVAGGGDWVGAEQLETAMVRLGGQLEVRCDAFVLGAVLDAHDGNVSAAARSLGLPRSTFRDRLVAS